MRGCVSRARSPPVLGLADLRFTPSAKGQKKLAAQSGWGFAPHAELRADFTFVYTRTWGCSVGARAGAWLARVEVATFANGKNAASETVRGADLGFAVTLGSAGW